VRQRKTDYPTIIMHWVLVAAILVAFVTGLRIATEAPDHAWINSIDVLLPRANVWVPHMEAAVVLVGVAVSYVIYIARSGLGRRVQLDKVRLRGLFGRKQARLGAFGAISTWFFFATMLALIFTGGLLYFGIFANDALMEIHWWASWAIPVFVVFHVLLHFLIGRSSQLLRIIRPAPLPPPPPRLDAVELLTMLVEKSSLPVEHRTEEKNSLQPAQSPHEDRRERRDPRRPAAPTRHPNSPAAAPRGPVRRRNTTLQSNPFVVAAAVAITGAWAVVATNWLMVNELVIHRIASTDAPILDGDTSDAVWRNIRPYSLLTNQGDNFDGTGESRIDIRAVHDGTWAYFLFTWQDPTRSLKQLPLIKKKDGWHVLHDGYEHGDEHAYNEDKFSVLFTTLTVDLAGDRTFHASPHPIANAPSTMTGRGLHYTPAEGIYADVWQWKATSGGPTGWLDDDHFGPPEKPTPMQANYMVPYKGGFAPDPGSANYSDNFDMLPPPNAENQSILPRRLPRDLAATTAAMGQINLDPNVGESDNARWFMTEAESVPYSPELDSQIPIGTVLPGVIISGEYSGDRADVRCAARWASGHWALEVARRLDTTSKYDVPLRSGVFMRVSAFDHVQIRHTRHVRPIRIEVE